MPPGHRVRRNRVLAWISFWKSVSAKLIGRDRGYQEDLMAENTRELVPLSEGWRTRTLMAGGIIGALLGLLSAYLYVRAADDSLEPGEAPEGPQARDAAKLGVA